MNNENIKVMSELGEIEDDMPKFIVGKFYSEQLTMMDIVFRHKCIKKTDKTVTFKDDNEKTFTKKILTCSGNETVSTKGGIISADDEWKKFHDEKAIELSFFY